MGFKGTMLLVAVFLLSVFLHEEVHAYIFDCYGASDVCINWLPWPTCQGKATPAQAAGMDGLQQANEAGFTIFWAGLAFAKRH